MKGRGQPSKPAEQLYDLHIKIGLEDALFRVRPEDVQKFIVNWALGGEDVILRASYNQQETNLVLRGNDSGSYSARPAMTDKQVSRAVVILASEMREEFLRKMEGKS